MSSSVTLLGFVSTRVGFGAGGYGLSKFTFSGWKIWYIQTKRIKLQTCIKWKKLHQVQYRAIIPSWNLFYPARRSWRIFNCSLNVKLLQPFFVANFYTNQRFQPRKGPPCKGTSQGFVFWRRAWCGQCDHIPLDPFAAANCAHQELASSLDLLYLALPFLSSELIQTEAHRNHQL